MKFIKLTNYKCECGLGNQMVTPTTAYQVGETDVVIHSRVRTQWIEGKGRWQASSIQGEHIPIWNCWTRKQAAKSALWVWFNMNK